MWRSNLVSDHWSQYHVHEPKEESPPRSVRTYEIDADRDKVNFIIILFLNLMSLEVNLLTFFLVFFFSGTTGRKKKKGRRFGRKSKEDLEERFGRKSKEVFLRNHSVFLQDYSGITGHIFTWAFLKSRL